MSEEEKESSGLPDDTASGDREESSNADEKEEQSSKKDSVSYESYQRLLGEKKKLQRQFSELEKQKEQEAQSKLKEQGRYKEMYEKVNGELSKLESQLVSAAKASVFKDEALKAGADPTMIEVLERIADLKDVDVDGYKPDRAQVRHELEKIKEKYGSRFFGKPKPTINDGTPSKEKHETGLVAEAKGAKTQRELDAVLRKHGY